MVLSICRSALVKLFLYLFTCLFKKENFQLIMCSLSPYGSLAQEAYVRVLLDGGPTRAFSDSDIPLMEEDLSILKVSN